MIGEDKVMRTMRVRNDQAPGVLGRLLLALSNPVPEIDPDLALSSGVAFATDRKIINSVLRFPGILRGAVDSNPGESAMRCIWLLLTQSQRLHRPESCYPTHWINIYTRLSRLMWRNKPSNKDRRAPNLSLM
jgi:hypothetical protein